LPAFIYFSNRLDTLIQQPLYRTHSGIISHFGRNHDLHKSAGSPSITFPYILFQQSNAGITTSNRLSIHCFIKGYGTNIANLGTPIHTLKQLMGHSNVETTMGYYLHSSDANQKKTVEGLDKLAQPLYCP